ncbi:hypothetical protein E1265_27065 [Streptomyces sp. 8K308]|uniref:hypothetical protein n=1 Tax=Streptomyces sp. 8K308 TaxID=2530388 RepID=UPI00104FEC64|nr:hypothetical protein [Streptomyces sp. 8K308]TDC15228.1 hypothetical protein E1265_27065 [Streptomyces sp. 8K308]
MDLVARAEYDTDWHLYMNDPQQGPLGYCTGVGPDEDFDPAAATRTLEEGWRVTGSWIETPPDSYAAFTAIVTRAQPSATPAG